MHINPLLAKRMQAVFAKIEEITPEALLKKIKASETLYLVDVREDSEWARGSLQQAIHITRGKLELNIEKLTNDVKAEIILYCGGGTRSALAADNLQAMGYQNVKSLKGGFRGWLEMGYPVDLHG